MPPDFAVVYHYECLPALPTGGHVSIVVSPDRVRLTTGTHDLEDVYREMSSALLAPRNDLLSWRESAPPEVLGDRVELQVLGENSYCARVSTSTPFAIHVRAAGTWTRLWPSRQETSRTAEYEQQMRELSKLLQRRPQPGSSADVPTLAVAAVDNLQADERRPCGHGRGEHAEAPGI